MMTRTLTLKRNQPGCEPTKTLTRKCRQECRYQKGEWSECNPTTNMRTNTMTLKKGPSSCAPTKELTKKCKKACKYQRSTWGDCDASTGKKTMTMTLKEGDAATCNATLIRVKSCRVRRQRDVCRYSKGEWGECDTTTNTKTRTLTLRNGGEDCEQTKTITRRCRKVCKYDKGTWSECNTGSPPQKTRTDKLRSGSDPTCEATRVVTKNCRIRNGGRDRTGLRPAGNGKKERCQFGQWPEFGPCTNGVKTRTRTVLAGHDKCQRRAVQTRTC